MHRQTDRQTYRDPMPNSPCFACRINVFKLPVLTLPTLPTLTWRCHHPQGSIFPPVFQNVRLNTLDKSEMVSLWIIESKHWKNVEPKNQFASLIWLAKILYLKKILVMFGKIKCFNFNDQSGVKIFLFLFVWKNYQVFSHLQNTLHTFQWCKRKSFAMCIIQKK